jgi:outer membrane receptor protein involved in Fe transport
MSPLIPEPSRRRRAIVVLTAVVALASALLAQHPVFAQQEPDSAEVQAAEGTVVLPPDEEEDSAPKATSLTAAIKADSGVSVQTLCTNCNNANLSIAGFANEHVALICDGIIVPSGLAQIYLLSVMPPTRIDKVDVDKGASDAALPGGTVGGGIKLERVEPKEDQVSLAASADVGSYGWAGGRVDVTGRSGWFGGYFVGTYSLSDKIDANLDDQADLPSSERHTLEFGFDLIPADPHRVRLGFTRYNEDQKDGPANPFFYNSRSCIGLDQVIGNSPCNIETEQVHYNREDVQLNREQFDLRYDLSLGSTRLALIAASAKREQEIQQTEYSLEQNTNVLLPGDEERLLDEFGLTPEQLEEILGITLGPLVYQPEELIPFYDIDEENEQATLLLTQEIGYQSVLRAGAMTSSTSFEVIDFLLNRLRQEGFAGYPLDARIKEELTERGAWVEWESGLGPRIELLVGLRYTDWQYEDNEAELNALLDGARDIWQTIPLPEGDRLLPRAALTWKTLESLQFRFSAGTGLRSPAPAFDKVCCGRQYRGNRGLELEESSTYGIEATYQPGPRWRVGLSGFHTEFDNQVINMASQSDWSPSGGSVVHVYQNVNMRKSRLRSVSLEGKFQAPLWMTTRVSYTWLDPQNRTPGGAITALVDPGGGDPFERTFFYGEGVPYTTDRRAALGFEFSLPPQAALSLNVQYTGPTLIQQFLAPTAAPTFGIEEELAEAEDFWVANVRFSKTFRSGTTLYAGIDNVLGYVQGGGCDLVEAQLNPNLVGCLGDPRFDFNWGPLRGRYYYFGLGYQFTN